MGQILRYDTGPVKISAHMLTEIDWLLDMHTAAPLHKVKQLVERMRADPFLVCDGAHDYLDALEVYAVQRLRGWHRLRHGTVTVAAEPLCDVRNLLDGLVLSWAGCEEYANDLSREDGASAELAIVRAALAAGRTCDRCERCQFLIMRDRIDVLLDAQGFEGSSYYRAYVAGTRDYDPELVWRERVTPVAEQVSAGA